MIGAKFFLKKIKIEIEKTKSNNIGRARRLNKKNVVKNKKIYIKNFFIVYF
jgi:hypothetical protein